MTQPPISSADRKDAASPLAIILAGCILSMLTFGPRGAMGFFQLPVISDHGWGRDTFGFALAVQNLLWGLGQPFAGAVADRFGAVRVLVAGLVTYAASLVLMSVSSTPLAFNITAGVMFGFALSGCSFNLVLAAFGKLLPPEWRAMAFGFGTASGSFGQFLFSPLSVGLIDAFGWRGALYVFAGLLLVAMPLAFLLRTDGSTAATSASGEPRTGLAETLARAFSHRSYVLLVLGFFTCGFQLAFITVHLPAYLRDAGLSPAIGGWVVALIGLFNVLGSLSSGWLCNRMPKRYLLAIIYALRSLAILALIALPVTPATALFFGASMGLLWLSTVPPTSSLVALMFGTRDMAMLYGFVFFSHQVGGFLGVWLGGIFYEAQGNYDLIWYASIALGIASAIVNLPIEEKAAPVRVATA
ncbi:MAG TPA: MFS transporter [Beijerinckiaceae bacterium]|nr:MFS transporter [Beijerinckiaceae bacterium]